MQPKAAIALPILLALAAPDSGAGAPYADTRFAVMGTYAEAKIRAKREKRAREAVAAVRLAFEEANASLSNWTEESALSRLNREAAEGAAVPADETLRRCLETAFEVAERTDGAFDPTVGPLVRLWGFRPKEPRLPSDAAIEAAMASVGRRRVEVGEEASSVRFLAKGMEIDLGGIGKGCALDLARERALAAKATGGLLDLGGNLLVFGEPPGGGRWKVGIRDPERRGALAAVVEIERGSVATSGNYETKHVIEGRVIGHILDASTGRPADTDVISATALAESAAVADALSTALVAAGSRNADALIPRFEGAEAIVVVRRGARREVLASRSLAGRLVLKDDLFDRAGGEIRFVLPPSETVWEDVEKALKELSR